MIVRIEISGGNQNENQRVYQKNGFEQKDHCQPKE
jgi:hypothetical protein